MKHTLIIIFLLTAFSLRSQVVSNVTPELVDNKVAVHYSLRSTAPANCFLSYSADGGRTFHPCVNVGGDLWSQTSGDKTITWDYFTDNITTGTFFFKVEAQKVEQVQPVATTPVIEEQTATNSLTPEIISPKNMPSLIKKTLYINGNNYYGDVRNGKPDGKGRLTYSTRERISENDMKKTMSEPGDYLDGKWNNGELERGTLYDREGNKKTTIIIGRF